RIKAASGDPDTLFLTAYRHEANDTYTIVIINSDTNDRLISVAGDDLPSAFSMYRTTSDNDNCTLITTVETGSDKTFVLPGRSIVTLQAGGDPL
ncbi:MAG TPA: hypothetical protein VIH22_11285, partial [Cyclobacteriaceae bacterium]